MADAPKSASGAATRVAFSSGEPLINQTPGSSSSRAGRIVMVV